MVESSCELTLDPLNLFSEVGEMWSLNDNEGGLDRFRGLGKAYTKNWWLNIEAVYVTMVLQLTAQPG